MRFQGKRLFELAEVVQTEPYIIARINAVASDTKFEKDENYQALIGSIKDMALQIIRISPNIPSEAAFAIKNIESHHFLLNFISANLNISVNEKLS